MRIKKANHSLVCQLCDSLVMCPSLCVRIVDTATRREVDSGDATRSQRCDRLSLPHKKREDTHLAGCSCMAGRFVYCVAIRFKVHSTSSGM